MAEETEGWFRELKGDRIECSLKADGYYLHMTGPTEHVREMVGHFEEWTGKRVHHPEWKDKRFGKPPKPMEGQTTFDEGVIGGRGA